MSNVQNIILRLRAKGYSQEKLAKEAKTTQACISRWESGKVPDSADLALRLLSMLESQEADSSSPQPH